VQGSSGEGFFVVPGVILGPQTGIENFSVLAFDRNPAHGYIQSFAADVAAFAG